MTGHLQFLCSAFRDVDPNTVVFQNCHFDYRLPTFSVLWAHTDLWGIRRIPATLQIEEVYFSHDSLQMSSVHTVNWKLAALSLILDQDQVF